MKNTGMRAVYSLIKKGYCLGELIGIYYEAINVKKIAAGDITEEYLLNELNKKDKESISVIDRETYNIYYRRRYDFTHPTYGLVYPISKIGKDGKVSIIAENKNIYKVDYQSLTPVKEPSELHRLMFRALIPKYSSRSGRIDRAGIYDILRIYGEDSKLLGSLGIILNPIYNEEVLKIIDKRHYKERLKEIKNDLVGKTKNLSEEIKTEFNTMKDEIVNNDDSRDIRNLYESDLYEEAKKTPRFICLFGTLTQDEVDIFVEKLGEDLALLELIGIIPNPEYIDPNQSTSGYIKK